MAHTLTGGRLPGLDRGVVSAAHPVTAARPLGPMPFPGSRAAVTFYATIDADSLPRTVQHLIPAVPVLLPASSFARRGFRVPRLPDHVTERAADSGGFVATFKWGDYQYTPAQYVDWLQSWQPTWAATMDYCCEDEITSGNAGIVQQRQERTTALARSFWEYENDRSWVWVPTVQGWHVEDYQRHARALRPLVLDMWHAYTARGQGDVFRVGIGTLCRRASTAQIRAIVRAVSAELPGVGFHLWGIKLGALADGIALPSQVKSVDSAAWKGLYSGRERQQAGMKQRVYAWVVELPAYRAKVERALNSPKQGEMF